MAITKRSIIYKLECVSVPEDTIEFRRVDKPDGVRLVEVTVRAEAGDVNVTIFLDPNSLYEVATNL